MNILDRGITPESEFSCPRSATSSLPPNYLIYARTFGNLYNHLFSPSRSRGLTLPLHSISNISSKNRVGEVAIPWQANRMSDYQRIAEAIRFLDAHRTEQPDLSTLSAHIGLSPSRFHHLFCAWAGATPKDFLQCLTLSHARELLRHGENVLNTALTSGLSGPGRLHDLCVTLDAATPGEIKARGEGLTIRAGYADSPFGLYLLGQTPRGICHLSFFDEGGLDNAIAQMQADWPKANVVWDQDVVVRYVNQIFSPISPSSSPASTTKPSTSELPTPDIIDGALPTSPSTPLKLYVRGTPFQLRVWRALLQVPPGMLISYGKLATATGNPHAARATGSAVGENPISFLIPCHRVIRETGVVGHYRWGAVRKRAVLAWESSRTGC